MTEYETRSIILIGEQQRKLAKSLIDNAPYDIEVVLKQKGKKRTNDQNKLMWSGMIGDFTKQGWLNGRQYNTKTWHEFLKREYLPEHEDPGITRNGYKKWDELPNGELILTGSTTGLTTKGFSQYLEQCYAFGSQELGIRFTTVNNNE